jgi:hypothetical protein
MLSDVYEDDKEVVVKDITKVMKIFKKYGIWYSLIFKYQNYGCPNKFRQRNSPELWPND